MKSSNIYAPKINTPIQLLAVWFIGLIAVNGSFLTAASQITSPIWLPPVLVIAAVLNVPIFLACLFLLQTRFRPEMQEDRYYAQYLETRYSSATGKQEVIDFRLERINEIAVPNEVQSYIKVEEPVSEEPTEVWLNDLLPSYRKIASQLRSDDVAYQIFGSSAQEPETPDPFIITIAGDPSFELFQKIVRIADGNGLMSVRRTVREYSTSRIYIGSFSYRAHPVVGPLPDKQLIDSLLGRCGNWKDAGHLLANEPL